MNTYGSISVSRWTILLVSYPLVRDIHICWCEVYPIADINAHIMANEFISGLVSWVSTSGVITTDRGQQFKSSLFGDLTKILGSKWIWTTSYHPESNGLVEWFHCSLKSALRPWWSIELAWKLTHSSVKTSYCSECIWHFAQASWTVFFPSPPEDIDITFMDHRTVKMANLACNTLLGCKKQIFS